MRGTGIGRLGAEGFSLVTLFSKRDMLSDATGNINYIHPHPWLGGKASQNQRQKHNGTSCFVAWRSTLWGQNYEYFERNFNPCIFIIRVGIAPGPGYARLLLSLSPVGIKVIY